MDLELAMVVWIKINDNEIVKGVIYNIYQDEQCMEPIYQITVEREVYHEIRNETDHRIWKTVCNVYDRPERQIWSSFYDACKAVVDDDTLL